MRGCWPENVPDSSRRVVTLALSGQLGVGGLIDTPFDESVRRLAQTFESQADTTF